MFSRKKTDNHRNYIFLSTNYKKELLSFPYRMPNNGSHLIRSAFYFIASIYNKLPKMPREKKFTTLVGQVLSYVEENYKSNISLDDFSKKVGYDYHYLSNVVNDGLKENFRSYLNRFRVQKAIELLKREDVQNAISKGLKYLGE